MSVATSTAIIIAGGVAAGGTYLGARANANASKEVAKTQAESTDKALAVQKEMYQQQRADEAPYLQLGTGAVGALGFGLGLTPSASASTAKPTTPQPPATPNEWWKNRLPGERAGVPQGALGNLAGGPQPNSGPANGIPMRSPNGQVTRVAPDQVAHYTELGAQVV